MSTCNFKREKSTLSSDHGDKLLLKVLTNMVCSSMYSSERSVYAGSRPHRTAGAFASHRGRHLRVHGVKLLCGAAGPPIMVSSSMDSSEHLYMPDPARIAPLEHSPHTETAHGDGARRNQASARSVMKNTITFPCC